MNLVCPKCQSTDIKILNYAKKSGGTVGALAGAICGAQAGTEYGVSGTISGAIMGAITGGIAGGTAGLTLGTMIDTELLNNFKCLSCEHRFSQQIPKIESPYPYPSPFSYEDE